MKDQRENVSPTKKADAALKESIYRAFWKDNFLRTVEYYEVDVHVQDGFVCLDGHIVGATSQSLIENAIRVIPGISGIKNNLVLDDTLISEVTASLRELEQTHGCKFFTEAAHGVISLNGIVSNANVKLLAERRAAGNPNVRGVINNVRVLGENENLTEQPFLQPAIGENIYFLDGIFGVVKQVVINPNNRRVIAIIVEARFTEQPRSLNFAAAVEGPFVKQMLVIPLTAVRYLTTASGFLDINSGENKRYMRFDRLHFCAPQKDWKTPYPYRAEDVLFLIDQDQAENQVLQQLYLPSSQPMAVDPVLKDQLLANDSLGG